MKPVSLADITYEQGLELLSMRKEALDSGASPRISSQVLADSYFLRDSAPQFISREKVAFELKTLTDAWKNTPSALKTTAMGGVAGAGFGLGKTMLDDEDDNYLRNMATGGIGGAAIGGAAGLAFDSESRKKITDRITDLGEGLVPPNDKETPEVEAKRRYGNSNNPEQELLDAKKDAKGLLPVVDTLTAPFGLDQYNTADGLMAAATTAGPMAGVAAYQARNPSQLVDPAMSAMNNPGNVNFKNPALQKELNVDQLAKDLTPPGKPPKKGRVPPSSYNKEMAAELKQQMRAQMAATGNKVPKSWAKKIKPAELAAFSKFRDMVKNKEVQEIDEMFKRLGISPGQLSGKEGINLLDEFGQVAKPGSTAAEAVGKLNAPLKRVNTAKAIQEIIAAPSGRKTYQAARHLRRVPKGRLAALAAAGLGGRAIAKHFGMFESAAESAVERQRRQDVLKSMEYLHSLGNK
tara:strand:- start:287 stop:1678 length:1392 start_codon:yes stop_codon:yes gene_type:complete